MELRDIKVFALILNYNTAEESIKLFNNLAASSFDFLKILIIDNASNDSDIIKLKDHIPKDHLVLNSSNLGYAGGNNIGIEIALKNKADYIWLLNPDIRVDAQALPLLIETFEENDMLAAVGPRILKRENPARIFSDGELLLMDEKCTTIHKNSLELDSEVEGKVDYDIDYIDGSSILFASKAIEDIGRFNEEFFLYFEETDWCFRAKKKGWDIAVNSNARVYNLDSKKEAVFHYYFMRNKLLFSKKHHSHFKKVRNYYFKEFLKEIIQRAEGKYFRPFYRSRWKGLWVGLIKTFL